MIKVATPDRANRRTLPPALEQAYQKLSGQIELFCALDMRLATALELLAAADPMRGMIQEFRQAVAEAARCGLIVDDRPTAPMANIKTGANLDGLVQAHAFPDWDRYTVTDKEPEQADDEVQLGSPRVGEVPCRNCGRLLVQERCPVCDVGDCCRGRRPL